MTERRFSAGQVFDIPPMQFRIVEGRKQPVAGEVDLVLQWRHVAPWQSVTLDHVALVLDMVAENEDVALFPPRLGFKGNAYVVEFAKTRHPRRPRPRPVLAPGDAGPAP